MNAWGEKEEDKKEIRHLRKKKGESKKRNEKNRWTLEGKEDGNKDKLYTKKKNEQK